MSLALETIRTLLPYQTFKKIESQEDLLVLLSLSSKTVVRMVSIPTTLHPTDVQLIAARLLLIDFPEMVQSIERILDRIEMKRSNEVKIQSSEKVSLRDQQVHQTLLSLGLITLPASKPKSLFEKIKNLF